LPAGLIFEAKLKTGKYYLLPGKFDLYEYWRLKKMSELPSELRYASSHEWARLESDGTVTVGITDHAQNQLGDVIYVEVPEVGRVLSAGEEAGVVESVKAASDIYAPVSGEVIAVNQGLEDEPELINSEPYDSGWFFKMRPDDVSGMEQLMSADDYAEENET